VLGTSRPMNHHSPSVANSSRQVLDHTTTLVSAMRPLLVVVFI
jgi:hypothetical protein